MKWVIGVVLMMLLVVSMVCAETSQSPQQDYNRIYMTPFYRESMALNTNYTYNLSVRPPGGVSAVVSAIISFNGQINGQTQNFQLWVNGQSCNTVNYTVATAFSTTGNVQFSFDCANRITQVGNYTLTLRSSVNTGAMSGWLDLTYMDRPLGSAEIHGTEYVAGDPGTMFLLLKDSSGVPIGNATCNIDIYYPNQVNVTHAEWVNNGLMRYLEEGLYYYDFTAPAIIGLYMVSAQCSYAVSNVQYYTVVSGKVPVRKITTGTYTGDPFVLNDYTDLLYTSCASGGGSPKACDSYYDWVLDNTTYTSLGTVYLGEATTAATISQYYWNWSSSAWVVLPNTLTFKATASSAGPSGVDEYLSNTIPLNNYSMSANKTVRVRTYSTSGSAFTLYTNWLAIIAAQATTAIQDLKGSGEIHVSSSGQGQGETSKYLHIDTCNGFVDGRCGYFTNDAEFDVPEGEIEDLVNVTAFATLSDQTLRYYTPFSVDCTAIDWLKEWNGTEWKLMNLGTDYTVYSQPAVENCEVTISRDVVVGQQYQYWLKMDNYMKWEVDWSKAMNDAVNKTIARVCDPLYNYTIPIVQNTSVPTNNTLVWYCYRSKDDQYYIDQFYSDSQSVTVAGEYASYVQEMRFYRNALLQRYQYLITENDLYPDAVNIANWTNRTLALSLQINATTNATGIVVGQINATTNATASLVSQIWTWVQSIFNWTQSSAAANQKALFVEAQYYQQQAGSVLVQVQRDGASVAGASCTLNVYYPNMTVFIANGAMTFSGVDGMYNYSWTPATYGSHIGQVNCSGGTLTGAVQSSGSLGVSAPSSGIVMQSVS